MKNNFLKYQLNRFTDFLPIILAVGGLRMYYASSIILQQNKFSTSNILKYNTQDLGTIYYLASILGQELLTISTICAILSVIIYSIIYLFGLIKPIKPLNEKVCNIFVNKTNLIYGLISTLVRGGLYFGFVNLVRIMSEKTLPLQQHNTLTIQIISFIVCIVSALIVTIFRFKELKLKFTKSE